MPAIASPPQNQIVYFCDMPFATKEPCETELIAICGESSRKSLQEGLEAIRRFRNPLGRLVPRSYLLDPLASLDSVRDLATMQGINLDAVIAGASQHFGLPTVKHRTEPLSQEELESLFEDDQRALDR